MNEHSDIAAPMLKVATVWAAIGITSWSDMAAFLAAVYSLLLLIEWLWKKVFRPFAVWRGWVKPVVGNVITSDTE
jgi:hypothetical protein